MAKPTRREGILTHGNRRNRSDRIHGSTNTQCNRSRHDGGAKMEISNVHAKDIHIPNARPAHHQHINSDHRGSGERAHNEAGEDVYLQKVLAQVDMASRRMAKKPIDEGRVEVDGKIVTRRGVRVDPNMSVVRADGSRVIVSENIQYFVLNRPRGIQSTMHDDMGRPCAGDIVGEKISAGQRPFYVGRLDAATEGLLLLTNDDELTNRLMHPDYEVTKTYMATVVGEVDPKAMRGLGKDVELDDGIAKVDMTRIIDVWQGCSIARIELHEDHKHIVRWILKTTGFPVERLMRAEIRTAQLDEQTPEVL